MTDDEVARLLARPEFARIDRDKFPRHLPLEGILRNDARIVRYEPGDIVIRQGDYGNSAFLILDGSVRVVLKPDLPDDQLGRQHTARRGVLAALSQLWTNRWVPEVRDTGRYAQQSLRSSADLADARVFLQDIPRVIEGHQTAQMQSGDLFGELAALGRTPRAASIFADSAAELLEIRWQGLRELWKFDPDWRKQIEEDYRKRGLAAHLRATELFRGLDLDTIGEIAEQTLFETYGAFDWHVAFKKLSDRRSGGIAGEPVVARKGDYPDGVLMIRAGFARVSVEHGRGHRTLTYLGAGDLYGFDELYAAWRGDDTAGLDTTLTALGYVDILRIPAPVMEEHVFPKLGAARTPLAELAAQKVADDRILDWAVEERFINATKAMLIDLDRCVRCDDCVRACASTHGGNPRFIRHGQTFDHWMVANACMHCTDPVCMIGCPTGAIHREPASGTVVINDDTCIGCGTCANSCPYENIRLVPIRDTAAKPLVDPATQRPIVKATKCDLCVGNPGGPACVRACPHDALKRVDFRSADPFGTLL